MTDTDPSEPPAIPPTLVGEPVEPIIPSTLISPPPTIVSSPRIDIGKVTLNKTSLYVGAAALFLAAGAIGAGIVASVLDFKPRPIITRLYQAAPASQPYNQAEAEKALAECKGKLEYLTDQGMCLALALDAHPELDEETRTNLTSRITADFSQYSLFATMAGKEKYSEAQIDSQFGVGRKEIAKHVAKLRSMLPRDAYPGTPAIDDIVAQAEQESDTSATTTGTGVEGTITQKLGPIDGSVATTGTDARTAAAQIAAGPAPAHAPRAGYLRRTYRPIESYRRVTGITPVYAEPNGILLK